MRVKERNSEREGKRVWKGRKESEKEIKRVREIKGARVLVSDRKRV